MYDFSFTEDEVAELKVAIGDDFANALMELVEGGTKAINWISKTKRFEFGDDKVLMVNMIAKDRAILGFLQNPNLPEDELEKYISDGGTPQVRLVFKDEKGIDALIEHLEALKQSWRNV